MAGFNDGMKIVNFFILLIIGLFAWIISLLSPDGKGKI